MIGLQKHTAPTIVMTRGSLLNPPMSVGATVQFRLQKGFRQSGKYPRYDKSHPLITSYVNADRFNPLPVIPDTLKGVSEGEWRIRHIAREARATMMRVNNKTGTGSDDAGREYRLHPIVSSGEGVPFGGDRKKQFTESQGKNGKRHGHHPGTKVSDDRSDGPRDEQGSGNGQEIWISAFWHEQGNAVGAQAKIGTMAEGEKARIAQQDIKTQGK